MKTHLRYQQFFLKFIFPVLLLPVIYCPHVVSAQDQNPPVANGDHAQSAPAENKITPKQAEELFGEVDSILKFVSQDTGLPIKKEVKRKLVTREEVVSYLHNNMKEDKDAQRLQRSELVLKKFGLLPREFDLKTFLVSLLREQVAGYYDPKTQTVNLLDWLDVEQQRPVLAHELTHALQDQSFGIEKWMKEGDTDLNDIKNLKAEDIEKDEVADARQSVTEGQATATLLDYMLAPAGKTALNAPQMIEAMKAGMLVGSADAPEFQNAPIFIKESLTFPYRYGLDFTIALLRAGGKEKAYAQAFVHPPLNTRQIMEPQTYLSGETIPPVPLFDIKNDLKDYDRFDIGAMGEFDVALLVDQYEDAEKSKDIYPAWRGGYYYAVRPKTNANAPLAVIYFSRWESPAKAQQFAAIYAKSLLQRYKPLREITDTARQPVDLTHLETLAGSHTWMTEEGPVTIHSQGDELLIAESLDPATMQKIDQELLAASVAAH